MLVYKTYGLKQRERTMLNEVLIPCQGLYFHYPSPFHSPLLALSFPLAMEAVEFEHSLHPLRVQGVSVKEEFWCSQPMGQSCGE